MILIGSTEAPKGFCVMPDENCTHLLGDGGLPGIIFPRAVRRTPPACGHLIGVHTMNARVLHDLGMPGIGTSPRNNFLNSFR
jgi:hypothetical protein